MKTSRRKPRKESPVQIKDRIRELRRVLAADLLPNPRNWRIHPQQQRDALQAVLAEIGYANALLARETADGRLMLIDGHLRAETTPQTSVPVLVLDVTEEEADKLLATLDPLSSIAGTNSDKLAHLLEEIQTQSPALKALLTNLASRASPEAVVIANKVLEHQFNILITCTDEPQQTELLQRFTDEGLLCRALVV
jgi:hypothetical protein